MYKRVYICMFISFRHGMKSKEVSNQQIKFHLCNVEGGDDEVIV